MKRKHESLPIPMVIGVVALVDRVLGLWSEGSVMVLDCAITKCMTPGKWLTFTKLCKP